MTRITSAMVGDYVDWNVDDGEPSGGIVKHIYKKNKKTTYVVNMDVEFEKSTAFLIDQENREDLLARIEYKNILIEKIKKLCQDICDNTSNQTISELRLAEFVLEGLGQGLRMASSGPRHSIP